MYRLVMLVVVTSYVGNFYLLVVVTFKNLICITCIGWCCICVMLFLLRSACSVAESLFFFSWEICQSHLASCNVMSVQMVYYLWWFYTYVTLFRLCFIDKLLFDMYHFF